MTLQSVQPRDHRSYDIVIVGAGPAGLMLSTCLARWGYSIKHVDNRPEPTRTGRADGIQPRSLELLRNMGLKSQIMSHNPARVYEVAFWNPSQSGQGIVRTSTWASCPDFIDARYPFTTLLHQGYIEKVFIDDLVKHKVEIQRPWTVASFRSEERRNTNYPICVLLKHIDGEETQEVRAKYLFGGEGARSFIRQRLNIGFKYIDPIEHIWAVMDGVVQTDFPDIKMKCTIHSHHGSIMVIPREDNMVRLYVQIASSSEIGWDRRDIATEQEIQSLAKKILFPYTITWERVEWYSVYPIGQGISDKYSLDERTFLGGDACHTHSPKAGQGMNTAFMDALNLAWKIHAVEGGLAHRDILKTYELERRCVALRLLAFDNRYANLFSRRQAAHDDIKATLGKSRDDSEGDVDEFTKVFRESCEFTSGYGVAYGCNAINWSPDHEAKSALMHPKGIKLRTGHVFTNCDVTRVIDANVVHLEQEVPLNGAFRIFIFAGELYSSQLALQDFATGLAQENSFIMAQARPDVNDVSHHEQHNPHSMFFTLCTVFAANRGCIDITKDVPGLLARYRYHVYADDRWDGRVPAAKASAHAKIGVNAGERAIVVVRPDGHVAVVVSLVQGPGTINALNEYFSALNSMRLSNIE